MGHGNADAGSPTSLRGRDEGTATSHSAGRPTPVGATPRRTRARHAGASTSTAGRPATLVTCPCGHAWTTRVADGGTARCSRCRTRTTVGRSVPTAGPTGAVGEPTGSVGAPATADAGTPPDRGTRTLRAVGDNPDVVLYLDETGDHPRITQEVGPDRTRTLGVLSLARGETAHVLSWTESRKSPKRFATAVVTTRNGTVVTGPDGKALCHLVTSGGTNKEGEPTPSVVLWEGTITVLRTYHAHEITLARTLTLPEWSWFAHVETVNHMGIRRVSDEIAMMGLRQQQAKAPYLDPLGLTAVPRPADVVAYIRMCVDSMPDSMTIRGQGPVILPDGRPVFATLSGTLDEHGDVVPGIALDMTAVSPHLRYYDVTPPTETDPACVASGLAHFVTAYREIPSMPAIPAAFMGSLFTACMTPLDRAFFNALLLVGEKGSGKTRLSQRYDAIQSRTIRDSLASARPVLNLGVSNGTVKGTNYRVTEFGGYSIAADDLLKESDSAWRSDNVAEQVSNLIRSFESGGGALGRVDRAKNRVVSGQSGELCSNLRLSSELSLPGASTLERLIVLPELTVSWNGGQFDTDVSRALSTPDAIEDQHHAWSAFVAWAWSHRPRMRELLDDAHDVTRQWAVTARTAERYAATLAGTFAFAEFAATHGIDASECVASALAALRECAERQTRERTPLADVFRQRVRMLLTGRKGSIMGRPTADEGGQETSPWSSPVMVEETVTDSGDEEITRHMPPNVTSISDLGLTLENGNRHVPVGPVFGFVKFPNVRGPGGRGRAEEKRWNVVITTNDRRWESLCHALTQVSKFDGRTFRPDHVLSALEKEGVGRKTRTRIHTGVSGVDVGNPATVIEIDLEWLFAETES